jgi:hypothetical protein
LKVNSLKTHQDGKFNIFNNSIVPNYSATKKCMLPVNIPFEIPQHVNRLSFEFDWNIIGRQFQINIQGKIILF